jgi:hypothetical protein
MYKVGDRWIWTDDNHVVRGVISELKSPNSIVIKWENGRLIQYNDHMIEEEHRLQVDKEYYRNEKLEQIGI